MGKKGGSPQEELKSADRLFQNQAGKRETAATTETMVTTEYQHNARNELEES